MTLIFVVIASMLGIFALAAVSGAPWVPAFKRDLETVLDDASLQPGQLFVELGSGDGRLLAAAAKRGARAVGYEINPLLYIFSWLRTLPNRKLVKIYMRDLWAADISSADVVMAFLVPRTVGKLETKVTQEMKRGSSLVSYIFELPNKKPSLSKHHWHIYKF